MNSHDQEKLLKEILPPDDLAEFRHASLNLGLAGLRRERRRRHILRLSAVAAAVACAFLGILLKSKNTVENQNAQVQPSPATVSPALASHVDFINDDQLLALFTNQPVALVGKPGEQRLVFLGKTDENSVEHLY